MVKKDMQSAMLDYFKNFTDLKVTVNEMFLSESSGIGPSLAKETAKERLPMTLSLCIWLEGKSPPGTNTSGDYIYSQQVLGELLEDDYLK